MKLREYVETLGKLGEPSYRVAQSRLIIGRALEKPEVRWAVSFSGGKDSLVMLELVLEQRPDIPIWWFDWGWDYPETHAFVDATERRLGRPVQRMRFEPGELLYGEDSHDRSNHLAHRVFREVVDGSFIGLRKAESKTRKYVLDWRGTLYRVQERQQWRCCPMADWTVEDIWRFIGARKLTYCEAYDALHDYCMIPPGELRIGPLVATAAWQFGSLEVAKRAWPELYNGFSERRQEG